MLLNAYLRHWVEAREKESFRAVADIITTRQLCIICTPCIRKFQKSSHHCSDNICTPYI